jgi:type IV secretory pathway VirB9-like protein
MRRMLLFLLPLFVIAIDHPTLHAADGIREVQYDERSVIPIQGRLRVSTTIVLPDGEDIVDYVCGDKDYWIINGAHNIAHVKPAKAGAWTNLNLVTTSGRIYTFRLQEGSDSPDFKVFVTSPGGVPASASRRFYTSQDVDTLRSQLADAQAAAAAAKQAAVEAIDAQRADYPSRLRFDYQFDRNKKPFAVSEIWHDGASTYIRCAARELPALYEEKDGTPNLVNYQVHDGTYVIPKVLDRGYLMVGKDKLAFRLATN